MPNLNLLVGNTVTSTLAVKNSKALQTAVDRLQELRAQDRVAIVHHSDADGVAAGVLLKKACEQQHIPVVLVHAQKPTEHNITAETIALLRKHEVTVLFTADICADNNPEMLEEVSLFAKVFVFDHHTAHTTSESTDSITILKPQVFFDEVNAAKFSTALLAYVIMQQYQDTSALDIYACLGIISDSGYEQHKAFVQEVFKKYQFMMRDNIRATKFARVLKLINFANASGPDAIQEAFTTLEHAKNIQEVLDKLDKYAVVGQAIKEQFDLFDARKQQRDDLYFFEIDSPYDLGSNLSTAISFNKIPDKTLIIMQKFKELVRVHARRQDRKVDMAQLLRDLTQDIPGASAGGHIPAAGASFPPEFYEQVKQRILS